MADPTDSTYLFEARRLAAQYHWRLIPTDAWAAAAQQTDPAPADVKATRCALFAVYAAALHAACCRPANSSQCDQAYQELYDYLWRQAYYWDAEAASDIAQEAITLVFRSFMEPGLARCTEPATFLNFAHGKLRAARTCMGRERARLRKQVSLTEDNDPREADGRSGSRYLADTRPGPEEIALQHETQAERTRWLGIVQPRVITTTLASLCELWRKSRLRRQMAVVVYTFVDQASDLAIAGCLGTTAVNIQPLRSRGLDKLAEQLNLRLAPQQAQGGCP